MAIVVVGGSGSGAGKTALVCGIVAALPDLRWNVVKIAAPGPLPRPPIWEDTLPGDDTDTGRFLAAGASRAFLASAPVPEQPNRGQAEPDLTALLDELWPHFGRRTNLIFESNSVVHHVRPDVCLMIQAVPQRTLPLPLRKPSFIAAVAYADAMVSLAPADGFNPDGLCLPGQEPKPIFHLANLKQISPPMRTWLRLRLGVA